mmetsp:Transcript_27165/g.44620  ORF Transcript_27165/g.44620 Transcript_27165/m.44620 type:complete len:97 (-) Transcript_27165:29-319(-)
MAMDEENGKQQSRLVITVNQVFTILVAMYNWNDWRKALQFAFPSRKGLVLKEKLTDHELQTLVFNGDQISVHNNLYTKATRNDGNQENSTAPSTTN